MERNAHSIRSIVAGLATVALTASATAAPTELQANARINAVSQAQSGGEFLVAAADCYAVGQQVAAQNGGELARASAASRGGQDVCVIVVLVPGKNGQRPRRVEVVVPAG